MSAPTTTAATVVRLRPVVYATPTPQGVQVRGGASSFTVSGGTGLWKVWQALAGWLADGVAPDRLEAPAARPEVARVVTAFLTGLRAHDMLVEVPAGWSDTTGPGRAGPDADVPYLWRL